MRKKLISILIANVLFLTNAGFTSLAVEQNIDESIAASSTEVTSESAVETDEGESQEGDGSDLYFDDVEYVKIQSFTELPEEVKNQQLKQGGRLEELNFPESLEVSVVADLGRDDRIREQLGRERELMREAEREALEAEEKDKASAEDTEEEPEEEIEEEENEEGEGFSQIIDGEEIYFFGSDSEAATQQTSAESASENVDQTEDEPEETSSGEAGIVGASNANTSTSASTGASVAESATAENTNAAPEPAAQEQSSSNESTDTSSVETTETPAEEPAETPSDAGNEGSGEESTPSEDLVGRIISIFRPLMVHAAEEVQEPVEKKEEETAEPAVEEEKEDASENEDASNAGDSTEENAGNSGDGEDAAKGNPAETPADNEEDVEETENEQVESIEIVSGIKWVLDPSRSDADPFSSEVIGKKFVFVPVLVIPDYYYIEAELPTITVDIVEDYFAFDKAVDVDGVKIRVRADEGVFPEGATLFAQKLQEEDERKVQDKVTEQLEEDTRIVKAYTFDIQIRDKDGKEIEPDTEKGRVFVSFETEEVSNADYDAEIYHVIEDENRDGASAPSAEEANKGEEAVAEENGENKENAEESATSEGSSVAEATAETSANGENASVDGGFTLKKLEATVVEGKEAQALEAETDGFSTYSLVFVLSDAINYELKTSSVSLEVLFDNLVGGGDITEVTISDGDKNFLGAEKLAFSDNGIDPVTGYQKHDAEFTLDGLYDKSDAGEYFLILKQLFTNQKKSIIVKYNNNPYTLNIEDKSNSEAQALNNGYPVAEYLDSWEFDLVTPVSYVNDGVLYQWQTNSENSDTGWKDIDLANDDHFHYVETSTEFIYEKQWFRCVINGTPGKAVQIITPNNDSRAWRTNCGASGTQCYITNGKIAYTIAEDASGTRVFDVVGEQISGTTSKMQQTTSTGEGWRLFSNQAGEDLTTVDWDSNNYELEYIYFAFDSDPKILHVTTKPKAGYKNVAVGATCRIAGVENNCITQEAASGTLNRIGVIGASEKLAVQQAVNSDADDIYSLVITPSTTVSSFYIGSSSSFNPYNSVISTESTIIEHASPAAVSLAWKGVSGTISFDLSLAGVSTNKVVTKVQKIAKSSSYSGGNVLKSVRLQGNELNNYAKSLGTPFESVEVNLKLSSDSSSSEGGKAIKSILPTYTKASNSTSTSSSSSSNSSTTTSYSADYFSASITEKIGTAKAEPVDVLPNKIQLEVSYDFTDKEDIHVYRYHSDSSGTSYSDLKQTGDGSYSIDEKNGKITIYSRKFSTFAIAYKPVTYYTVTFSGASVPSQKIKAGGKATKPADPVKDGYTFSGWYWYENNPTKPVSVSTSKSSNSSSSSSDEAKPYNFDYEVKSNITLTAGWTSNTASSLEASKAAAMADSDNESRAPKTGDDLPVVWLWVLLLVAGVTTFTVSAREIANAGKNPEQPKKRSKLQVYLLLAGIIIKTTFNFIVRKIRENKAKVLLGLSTAVILVSCIVLASTVLQYHKAESLYSDADVTYVETSEDEEVDEYVEEIKELAGEEPKFDWWDCAQVNLKELKAEYPEVVGWIYFENENISYPIMYSGDNAKYLKTAYTGEKAKAGAIFIDGESTPDFTDPHSLIYGHNMRDLSMFGRLRYYMTTPDYYQDHQYFQIFTEDKVYRYQIFAYEEVADNHDVFWVFGKEPTGYYKMLKEIEQGSYCNSGIITNESDHVITLATCTDKDNERLIVSAVRTDEYDYVQ